MFKMINQILTLDEFYGIDDIDIVKGVINTLKLWKKHLDMQRENNV
jgi:hypothetical protein